VSLGELLSTLLSACQGLDRSVFSNLQVSISAPKDLRKYHHQIRNAVYNACKQAGLSHYGCEIFSTFVARRVAGGFSYIRHNQQVGYECECVFDDIVPENLKGKCFSQQSDWSFLSCNLCEIQDAFRAAYAIAVSVKN